MNKNDTQNTVSAESLETPNLFASYRIYDYPRAGLRCHPWKMTDTQAILLNAFDLGQAATKAIHIDVANF